ncbi:MAG: cobalt transport protein CbiN [Lachnospiraceae bacterium]|nr:cobalt transport protein CbiN [Lachnospiraceae bacterium]
MSKGKLAVILLLLCAVIIIAPLVLYGNTAEFGGADNAGSEAISELTEEENEPWFTPVIESVLGMELPGEVESLLFCLQAALGSGIFFFFFGRYYERSKWETRTSES